MRSARLAAAVAAVIGVAGATLAHAQGIPGMPVSPYAQDRPQAAPQSNPGSEMTEQDIEEDIAALIQMEYEGEVFSKALTPQEQALIDAKRNTIIQYLYEREELESLRNLLTEAEREDRLRAHKNSQLSPEEILEQRRFQRETSYATNAPLKSPPDLVMRTVEVSLEDQKPLEVFVGRGYSSSVVFFDQTGEPWPLENGADALGDDSAFRSQTIADQAHMATFQVLRDFSQSNALVILEGLPVPIVLRLVGSDEKVDTRLTIRVPRMGPHAKVEVNTREELDSMPPALMSFMNGETLPGAVRYEMRGVPGEVYLVDGHLYLRTRANLITPSPLRAPTSSVGYNIYVLPPVTHLLFSVDGSMVEATIERAYTPTLAAPEDIFSREGY